MAQDSGEIEQSIRNGLPILFGEAETVDSSLYLAKRKAATEYAIAATGPFLTSETIRYQSILLYVSLVYITVSLFKVGTFKLGDAMISVDHRFSILYGCFILAMAAIFVTKSYVDYSRVQFTREKDDHAFAELSELISLGNLRKTVNNITGFKSLMK